MTPARSAFIEMQLALTRWRASWDAEAQVAHWLTEGTAHALDLRDARRRTRQARAAHQVARKRYLRLRAANEEREEADRTWRRARSPQQDPRPPDSRAAAAAAAVGR